MLLDSRRVILRRPEELLDHDRDRLSPGGLERFEIPVELRRGEAALDDDAPARQERRDQDIEQSADVEHRQMVQNPILRPERERCGQPPGGVEQILVRERNNLRQRGIAVS